MRAAQELADSRRRQQLSLAEMAQRTGIPAENLAALEYGDPEVLPDSSVLERVVPVYARALGLDPDDVTRRYVLERHAGPVGAVASPPAAAGTGAARTGDRRTAATLLAVIVGLIAGLLLSALLFRTPRTPASPEAVPDAPPSQTSPAAEPPAAATDVPAEKIPERDAIDLSGPWVVTNEVESTSYRAYKGLRMDYEVRLTQEGDRVRGTGFKRAENGRRLPRSRRTPINVEGTRAGDRLELSFTESGARRKSAGRFDLQVVDERTLRGSFTSDAADSRGRSVATRVPPDRD